MHLLHPIFLLHNRLFSKRLWKRDYLDGNGKEIVPSTL
jgi:hypothetical protein